MAPKPALGSGAQPDTPDTRDFQLSFANATSAFDWNSSCHLNGPQIVDQAGSDCCVACACSYFHWQLRSQVFSRRDLFARIASPTHGDGAEIRDGMMAIVNQGQALESDVPDPPVEDDDNMRDSTGVTTEELPWKEFNAVGCSNDIESIARAITLCRGAVVGLYLRNADLTSDATMEVPTAPSAYQMQNVAAQVTLNNLLKHALYVYDFHMHDNGDGQFEECLIAATSWIWGNTVHHIRKQFFTAGATFSPWCFVPSATVQAVVQNVTITTGDGSAGAGEKGLSKPRKRAAKTVSRKSVQPEKKSQRKTAVARKTAAKEKKKPKK
jgi:hypothetical protein